ncbi:oxygen-independent coproporphyrinogen III oxidase [Clostridium botulinum]|uniref:Heme chaperone HemW n=1 Tax=Clostridium botulinum (strain Okra / Type B1) TaxID=498213 RepID=B1ILM6_CLOBK|nr:radical SAM family heme chaperone HemW [Clostridium botulinum]EKX80379.1 coproporphyrinogen III oxidase [Clostridium botulinum CFSAN001628]ACA46853.1 oxygen-independent coproporphyrinogen III oxidase [Clostridium botulinum B1 str. Okra]MBD5563101.1 oxygen-independent coproporphyrinogen III oxidase [Clostridium botulinum]MBD5567682.1 oxygen-independent coproporphyrinogen III oxidase [Clostridium botulinum]MBD5571817.1 oxygen-independent coproporphyrinogen III oxidase [Clostridium botulinum]
MDREDKNKEVSLYIHIPFCMQKCSYCDFTSYSKKEDLMMEYVKALSKEIVNNTKNKIIKTIFIGGGTPTYLSLEALNILKNTLKTIDKKENIEFTVEGNPGTFTEKKLKLLKSMGVNRLSIGLQSSKNSLLKTLGRIHSFEDFVHSFKMARKEGFNNINVDLMFALPNQSLDDWKETLLKVVGLSPEHLSCYSLIIEEGTNFYNLYKNSLLKLPKEEEEREMYEYCIDFLKERGYLQYEISNFANPNKECRHNLVYWDLEDYIGCGVGAHSYVNNQRYENTSSIETYIKEINSNNLTQINFHINSQKENMEEFMFMGLRKTKGICIDDFQGRFGKNIIHIYGSVINKYKKLNLLIEKENRIYLSKEAVSISNTILSDFLL